MNELLIKRVIATLIDVAIVAIPACVSFLVFLILGIIPITKEWASGIDRAFIISAFFTLYYMIYDYVMMSKYRTTFGKRVKRIHVENENGRRKIATKNKLIRSLCKSLSLFAFYAMPAAISLIVMTNNESTSIHDKIARTQVWED